MHFYMFNPSDFNNSARHLSLVERAIYRDLIDMYYHTEQAIDTSDMDKLARRLLCTSSEYRTSLDYVLDEFFVKRGKRHHHHRIDKEIKNYKFKKGDVNGHDDVTSGHNYVTPNQNEVTNEVTPCHNGVTQDVTNDGVTMTDAERKRKSRQDKRNMIDELTNIGVSVDKSIKLTALRELHAKHINSVTAIVTNSIDNDVTQVVTTGHTTSHEGHAENAAITSNYEPSTNNQKPVSDSDTHTNAGEVIVNSSATSNANQPADTQPVTKADQIRSQHSIDIENWIVPTIDEMRGELFRAGKMMQLTDDQYAQHVGDFKAHYAEQALLGNPIITESNRKTKLRKWLAGEVDKQAASQARQEKARGRFTTDNEDWSSTTAKNSSHFDSDLPPIYHPSYETAKVDDNMPLFLNGCKRMPLPGMTNSETEAYVDRYVQSGEPRVAAYDRLSKELKEAV